MSILDVNGNVGIGTINPLSRLDIAPSGGWLVRMGGIGPVEGAIEQHQ